MDGVHDLNGFVLFAIGRTPVTVGGVLTGFAIIVGGFIAARIARLAIERVRGRTRHGRAALFIVEKLISYGLVILAFVIGMSAVGLNLSSLAVFAGAIGVGVGLGLQGVVKEFVSGLVLIFDRVLNLGDYIELEDGRRGIVHEIGPRAVRIRTNDNIDIVIPNSKFIEGPVVNWTLGNETRRIHIPFGVAYGSDRSKVRDVVLQAARDVPFTSLETDTHKTQVWLVGMGESALNFELLVWPTIDAVKRPAAVQAAYTWAIAEALECAGIEVPFAQLDVRLRSLFGHEDGEALKTLKLQEAPAVDATAPRTPDPSVNDAAQDVERPLPEIESLDEMQTGASPPSPAGAA